MARATSIDVGALRRQIDGIFEVLERHGVTSLELDEDFYWQVQLERSFDTTAKPLDEDIVVGSLLDELELLEHDQPLVVDFRLVGPILGYLAIRLGHLV